MARTWPGANQPRVETSEVSQTSEVWAALLSRFSRPFAAFVFQCPSASQTPLQLIQPGRLGREIHETNERRERYGLQTSEFWQNSEVWRAHG